MSGKAERTYSVTRTKATWKPRVIDVDPPVFRCPACGAVLLGVAGRKAAAFSGTGRTLVGEPPYAHLDAAPSCCGRAMEQLEATAATELPPGIVLDYAIVGGYNNNAVKLVWDIDRPGCSLAWAALKTFTGVQLSSVMPKKRSPLVFALADEDAYAYCDEDPCLECIFMCKRGFVFLAYVEGFGLVRLPLERAVATGSRGGAARG